MRQRDAYFSAQYGYVYDFCVCAVVLSLHDVSLLQLLDKLLDLLLAKRLLKHARYASRLRDYLERCLRVC